MYAEDENGTIVSSSSCIKTNRMLYLVHVPMEDLEGDVTQNSTRCKNEFKAQHITVNEAGVETIPFIKNIRTNAEYNTFRKNITKACASYDDKKPYLIGVGYAHTLAEKQIGFVTKEDISIAKEKSAYVIVPIEEDKTKTAFRLWYDIDEANDWFISAKYVDANKKSYRIIAKADCTPIKQGNLYTAVQVNVSTLPEGSGTIILTVNTIRSETAGFSFNDYPYICIATKIWGREVAAFEQNQVIIHELGHQIGLVPNGRQTLDKGIYHYIGKGHQGNHCYNGNSELDYYHTTKALFASKCVMFGATNGKTAFCADCAEKAKKTDISHGTR